MRSCSITLAAIALLAASLSAAVPLEVGSPTTPRPVKTIPIQGPVQAVPLQQTGRTIQQQITELDWQLVRKVRRCRLQDMQCVATALFGRDVPRDALRDRQNSKRWRAQLISQMIAYVVVELRFEHEAAKSGNDSELAIKLESLLTHLGEAQNRTGEIIVHLSRQ